MVKVLIVCDEDIEAMDIKQTLESFGYDVPYVASSGEVAIEKALEIMPDLILMDIVLKGDNDGIEVASKIKELNIPFIYLIAHSEEPTIERAKLKESQGYIIKPYDPLELKYAIELAIYKKQMKNELNECLKNEFLEYIVENIPNMIFLKSADTLQFEMVNKAGEELLGHSREELVGKTDYDFFPKDEADFFTKKDREVLQNKKLIDIPEETIETKNLGQRILHTKKIPIINKEGNSQYLLGISEDITETKKSEEKIQMLANVVESSDDAIITKSLEGLITSWNKGAELIYGYSAEDVIGKDISILSPPQLKDEINQLIKKIKLGERVLHYETIRVRKDGGKINVSLVLSPILDSSGVLIGISTIARDITERKKAQKIIFNRTAELKHANVLLKAEIKERKRIEEIIKDNVKRLNLALESADMGAWDLDIVNDTSIRTLEHDQIFGYDSLLPEWGLKNLFEHILPEDRENVQKRFEKAYETNKLYFQCRINRVDNKQVRWIESYGNVYRDDKNVPIRILGVVVDITERKETENQLLKVIDEKEMLLSEIHHRVKNNMQIISSLLNLQTQYVEEGEKLDVLKESQGRVKSMALIHEKLYQSSDMSHINFKQYIEKLVSDILQSYHANSGLIQPIIQVHNVEMNMETSIPCGLIINELVTNSMKHAFPEDRDGEVHVSLKIKAEQFFLTVSDNGVGFPEDLDFQNTESLGLRLVNSLTDQLDGEIEMDKSHGTEFKIMFKEMEYKERI